MENKNQTCPIWGVTVARIQQLHDMDGCLIEGSPRTGGDYKITGHAMDLVACNSEFASGNAT